MFGAAITTPDGGSDPDDRGAVRRLRHRRPARAGSTGASTAPTAPEPGHELVVHRDRRLPQGHRPGGQLPAVRELAGGRVPERRSPVRSIRTPGSRSCGRIVPTRRTSACQRTITVPAGGATMSFWTSYNLELDFDYMIVEAHTVGQDDWTTLPDLNGHTSSDLSNDQSCPGGWSNPNDAANVLHPFLTHYQTFDPATGTCSPDGNARVEWNAANGSSSGWQQLRGRPLALRRDSRSRSRSPRSATGASSSSRACSSTTSRSRPARAAPRSRTTAMRRTAGRSPALRRTPRGSRRPNRNDWVRRGGLGIKEGAVVATDGHGLHGLRLRGDRRGEDAQRGDGPRGGLPAALGGPGVGGSQRSRPPRSVGRQRAGARSHLARLRGSLAGRGAPAGSRRVADPRWRGRSSGR